MFPLFTALKKQATYLLTALVLVLGLLANLQLYQSAQIQPKAEPLAAPQLVAVTQPDYSTLAAAFWHPQQRQRLTDTSKPNQPPPARQRPLDINLLGIVHASDNQGIAILVHQGQAGSYRTGEYLHNDDSIQLLAVRPDHVTIAKGGYRQDIQLQRQQHSLTSEPAPRQDDRSYMSHSRNPERLQQYSQHDD